MTLPLLRPGATRYKLTFLAGLSLSALLAPGAQAQGPTLTTSTPPRNTVTASKSASLSLTFSHAIDAATAAAIKVHSARAGGLKAATYTVAGPVVTVDPLADFLPGETLTVTAPAALRSTVGAAATPHLYQFTTAVSGTGSGIFAPVAALPEVAVSNGGSSIALGDVDGDGDLDVVSSNYDNTGSGTSAALNVRLNSGQHSGAFIAAPTAPNPAAGTRPGNVALGDVDGDGDLDLLAINSAGSSSNAVVNVRLNNGAGLFTAPATNANPSVGPYTWFLVTGDIDGDGDLDILTAGNSATNATLGVVSLLLNQGLNSGNFVPPASNATISSGANSLGTLAVGDLDGDGDLDLVASSNTTVLLFLNNGAGSFAAPATHASFAVVGGGGVTGMALGDVDGDGDLDILTANATVGSNNQATGLVNVRLNSGLHTAHFVAPAATAQVPLDNVPRNVVLGDVDGDGDLDFVTANEGYSPIATTMSVRLNDGAGNFTAAATNADPAVGGSPRCVALGDVDGDGDLDAVTINTALNVTQATYQSTLSVRRNEPAALYNTLVAPATGAAGSTVVLTGTDFTGATGVSFNGTPVPAGSFIVTSPTTLSVTVPSGARSGPVYVTTPRGVCTTTNTFGVTVLSAAAASETPLFALYPNPAQAFVTVEVPGLVGAPLVKATLLNALGQVVATQAATLPAMGTRLTLPVAALSKGLYLVRLQVGAATATRRLVVD